VCTKAFQSAPAKRLRNSFKRQFNETTNYRTGGIIQIYGRNLSLQQFASNSLIAGQSFGNLSMLSNLKTILKLLLQTQYCFPIKRLSKTNMPLPTTFTIRNSGPQEIQLFNRYWLITMVMAKITEVKGPGVIGPAADYSGGLPSLKYSSGAIL